MTFLRPKRLEKKTSDAREPSLYRSICTSIISTLLSLVMLVGTTFAWFTDSITSGIYTIQAGNLKTETSYCVKLPESGEPNWLRLNEGDMSMFGGMTFTSGDAQTAYLKLANNIEGESKVDVVYKFRFESAGAETPGTLENGGTTEAGKKLSDMLNFKFVSANSVAGLGSATPTSQKLAEFTATSTGTGENSTTSGGPFEVVVKKGETMYVALTIAMDNYEGTWETQPSIQLRLQIDISNYSETGESQSSQQLMAAPPVVVGVYNVTDDTGFVTVTQTEQLATEKAETDNANTSGAAEDDGHANTSDGAVDTAADTAAVEPNAADDVPAADSAA